MMSQRGDADRGVVGGRAMNWNAGLTNTGFNWETWKRVRWIHMDLGILCLMAKELMVHSILNGPM